MDQNSIADFVKGFCPEIKKYEAYYYGYPEIADELCELVLTGAGAASVRRRLFRHPGQRTAAPLHHPDHKGNAGSFL